MALSRRSWFFIGLGALIIAVVTGVLVYFVFSGDSDDKVEDTSPTWAYKCEEHICKRVEYLPTTINETTSFNVCRLTCGENIGTLWPVPRGKQEFSRKTVAIDISSIETRVNNGLENLIYWFKALDRFKEMQTKKVLGIENLRKGLQIVITVNADSSDMTLNYQTFEGYSLTVAENDNEIHIDITAKNFYGVRHALETVSQLIVYDDIENSVVILSQATIEDEPKYPHRGISFDTSRHFYSTAALKRTINALAMVKMNTFHWHITDAHSFPMELKSHPELTRLGASSPEKIYKATEIKEIVDYAKVRGIRVIPEFDTPAHVGEGWQNTGLVICYKDPTQEVQWRGHFDPTKDQVYDILDDIYGEIVDSFSPNIFHIGADEVSIECWNSSSSIRDWMTGNGLEHSQDNFMELWGRYQTKAIERLNKHFNSSLPIIMWTSSLTQEPYLTQYIDKDRFIIQLWLDSVDDKEEITAALEKGYKVIMSNSDALYLDCGVGSWVDDGLNWCAPYKTWQRIYDNKLENIAGDYIDQVYGAEVTIWSESIDERIVDYRIWPRASAFAERMWSDPQDHWRKAEPRLLINREYLVNIGGVAAEMLQPEWCVLIEGECPS